MASAATLKVLRRDEGESLWWLGGPTVYKLVGRDTGGGAAVCWTEAAPGVGSPPRIQHREDEAFYVLSGEVDFVAGDQRLRAGPGTFLNVGKGTAHFFRNNGLAPARMLRMVSPSGFEDFQRAAGRVLPFPSEPLTSDVETDFERVLAAAPQYGVDLQPPGEAFFQPPRLKLLTPDAGPTLSLAGDNYVLKMTGEETGGAYALFEFHAAPGGGPPLHVHHREEEAFYLLEGGLWFEAGGQSVELGPGDFLLAPRDLPHRFQNRGAGFARGLIWVFPAGLDAYFREVGRPLEGPRSPPVPTTEADIARLLAAAPKYGMEIFAPAAG